MEVAITGEEAWLCLKNPAGGGGVSRLQRKMKGAVCSCLQLSGEVGNSFAVLQQEAWGAGLGKGKQKGEGEQKSRAASTQCFPPFWSNLLFEQQPKSQAFGWSSTRLCQLYSTPRLQNSPLVFTDAILSKPLPTAHSAPSASAAVTGTPTHTILPPHFPSVLRLHDTHYGQSLMRI